jgi:hypothetical protein
MASLTLVGTIHWDPNGLPRLMETLERESPHIITLEMSEYGVAFRERGGPSLKEKLFDILQGLYGKSTQKESGKLDRPQSAFKIRAIRAILLALELPFEFRADRDIHGSSSKCSRRR